MWKSLFAVVCALVLGGCFFGGTEDTSTAALTDTTSVAAKTRKLTPGVYVADYPWLDTTSAPLQSEFVLSADGSFRLFWIQDNEAFYDLRGTWAQHDSNVIFEKMAQAYSQYGMFRDYKGIENDTNDVRLVTDTSFTRREYSPVRQKPLWVSYSKRNFPALKSGAYLLVKTYPQDSATTIDVKFTITLDASRFLFSVVEDTLESFQAAANWSQIGSFLATEDNLQRQLDTSRTFPAWDTLGGLILKRLQTVSDTTFRMWSPQSFFDTASWDPYRRI